MTQSDPIVSIDLSADQPTVPNDSDTLYHCFTPFQCMLKLPGLQVLELSKYQPHLQILQLVDHGRSGLCFWNVKPTGSMTF